MSCRVTFFGHTHVQGGFWIDDSNQTEGAIEIKYASREGKQEFTLNLRRRRKIHDQSGIHRPAA